MKIIKLYVDGRIGEAVITGSENSHCSLDCPYFSKEQVSSAAWLLEGSCRLDTHHVFPKYGTVKVMNRTTRCKKAEIDAEEYKANENARNAYNAAWPPAAR